MSSRLIALFFLVFSSTSYAFECGISETQLYPKNHNIDADQFFMVENERDANSIFSIEKYNYYLKSEDGDFIRLQTFDSTRIGHYAQILMKPECSLRENTKYFFYSQLDRNKVNDQELSESRFKKARWRRKYFITSAQNTYRVHDDLQLDYKEIVGAQELKGTTSIGFLLLVGFQPNYQLLSYKAWFEIEIKDSNGNLYRTYLKPYQDKYEIGYWKCGGNMRFNPDLEYEVRSTPIVMNGLKGKTSSWINVPNPWSKVNPEVRKMILGR